MQPLSTAIVTVVCSKQFGACDSVGGKVAFTLRCNSVGARVNLSLGLGNVRGRFSYTFGCNRVRDSMNLFLWCDIARRSIIFPFVRHRNDFNPDCMIKLNKFLESRGFSLHNDQTQLFFCTKKNGFREESLKKSCHRETFCTKQHTFLKKKMTFNHITIHLRWFSLTEHLLTAEIYGHFFEYIFKIFKAVLLEW